MATNSVFALLSLLCCSCGGGSTITSDGETVRLTFLLRPPLWTPVNPEVFMNASELITSKGYPIQRRVVQTQDGYILGLQRIPHGKNEIPSSDPKSVVLLQHGILASSTCRLGNLANESLAFTQVGAGMDVWLCNSRGNVFNRRHEFGSGTN